MTRPLLFLLFASLAVFIGLSDAHTKLFSTKLIMQDGRPVGSAGAAPQNSLYVHIWGPANGEKYNVFANGDTWPSETLVRYLESRQRTTCTGSAPPMDRVARARPGEAMTFMWPTNNHGGEPIKIYWDRSGPLDSNAPEPNYRDWTRQENIIFSTPYRDSGSTQCSSYDFGDNPIGRIVKDSFPDQENAQNERYACWATFNLPGDIRPGLNRLLMGWDHPPNDAHFYDCYWVFVEGDGANGYSSNDNNPLFNPAVFDVNYYLNNYADLRSVFGDNQEEARKHWLSNGIQEGRRASPQFDPPFYLNSYPDLLAVFGANNFMAAIKHYVSNGMNEGRRGSP